jgi:hypothetical protein
MPLLLECQPVNGKVRKGGRQPWRSVGSYGDVQYVEVMGVSDPVGRRRRVKSNDARTGDAGIRILIEEP